MHNLDYPLEAIVSTLASVWMRVILFVAACCCGTVLGSLIGPDDRPGLTALIYAPVLWLVSPISLVVDLLTVILLIALLRAESTRVTVGCLAGVLLVWFCHGMLLRYLWA
jgi:hypothetical protein